MDFSCQNLTTKVNPRAVRVKTYAAELFVSIYHSLEAGIANTNLSFK